MHMIMLAAIGTAKPWEIGVASTIFFGTLSLVSIVAYLIVRR